MPKAPAPLYLDEDVSVLVAAILRARGFDVVTTRDAGRLGRSDSEQLAFGAEASRAILTHNRVDFERLHREWLEATRPHAGILIARRRPPQEIAGRVGRLLTVVLGVPLRRYTFKFVLLYIKKQVLWLELTLIVLPSKEPEGGRGEGRGGNGVANDSFRISDLMGQGG